MVFGSKFNREQVEDLMQLMLCKLLDVWNWICLFDSNKFTFSSLDLHVSRLGSWYFEIDCLRGFSVGLKFLSARVILLASKVSALCAWTTLSASQFSIFEMSPEFTVLYAQVAIPFSLRRTSTGCWTAIADLLAEY